MNEHFKDHFSNSADAYSQYRPGYPSALFEYLASLTPYHDMAWDCATGSGQAAIRLTEWFERVIATDASGTQIAAAIPHPRIDYRVAPAERCRITPASADLVTVAQALHWFDLPVFFNEVKRVLKPGGAIAVWSYNLLKIDPEIDRIIDGLYFDTLQRYWPEERKQVERGYADTPFPFTLVPAIPDFAITARWDLRHLLGYLGTWSAVQSMIRQAGLNPLEQVQQALAEVWGDPKRQRAASWPLSIRVGYNP